MGYVYDEPVPYEPQLGWSREEIDQLVADPKVDDVLTESELCGYLNIDHLLLKALIKRDLCCGLEAEFIHNKVVYRVAGLRRYLAWRRLVWAAYEAEMMHVVVESE